MSDKKMIPTNHGETLSESTIDNHVYELVRVLSLEEKVRLMSGHLSYAVLRNAMRHHGKTHYNEFPYPAGGNELHHIPEIKFCDGPRGVVCGNAKSTCFPAPILRGATFHTELEAQVGNAIATEISAYGGNFFGGVCINMPYHPGWGRAQESYGEDSFLLSQMGIAMVQGIQNRGVIACLKHYAFNQMENQRFLINVTCDKRTEREIFLRHFEKCINAGAGAIMSAYNKYNGIMCGHNNYLLNQVLKSEWGFKGFVISDFTWGVRDTIEAANGGQNVEMANTNYFGDNLIQAVKNQTVSEKIIDDAAFRIIRTMLLFSQKWQAENQKMIGCKEHRQLAKKCAKEGIVLLKNEHHVLPLDRKGLQKIAVFGKLAEQANTGDHGSSMVYSAYTVTPLQGILAQAESACEIVYYKGKNKVHARKLAKSADAVIVVAGFDFHDEGEAVSFYKEDNEMAMMGGDRTNGLGLHEDEVDLIMEVSQANQNSIVVLIGGSTILLNPWIQHSSAVLFAGYPGMEGGNALADILFGNAEPGGRLPFCIPEKESDLPSIDWNATEMKYEYWHGYEKLDHEGKKPCIPFGFGLSYTTFLIENVHVEISGNQIVASCLIQNTGTRNGSQVLQLYYGCKHSKVMRPVKRLIGFHKVHLATGEQKTAFIECSLEELTYYDENVGNFVLEHTEYEIMLGTSSAKEDLHLISLTI